MRKRSVTVCSSSIRTSTSRSGRARSLISASGSVPAASASHVGASVSTIAASPASCRCTVSAASRRGCRSRWAATRRAPTASSRPFADVCERAHLPLQSGSSRILKAMRRTYNRDRYMRLAAELREAIPDLALTTDLIVGFPGETEADFLETISAVEEVGFDSAFTFVYSPRAGTAAAAMTDQIPEEVKHDRIERLIEVVQQVAASRNAERVGRVEEVLVESPSRT